jgi:hypothetical protein
MITDFRAMRSRNGILALWHEVTPGGDRIKLCSYRFDADLRKDGVTQFGPLPRDYYGWAADAMSDRVVIGSQNFHSPREAPKQDIWHWGVVDPATGFRELCRTERVVSSADLMPSSAAIVDNLQSSPYIGRGSIADGYLYVPYREVVHTISGNNVSSEDDSPQDTGILVVREGHAQVERKISLFATRYDGLAIPLGTNTVHVFAVDGRHGMHEIVHVGVSRTDWTIAPTERLCKSGARRGGGFTCGASGDAAHLCWADERNEKKAFRLMNPGWGNYEIYYRRRDDKTGWGPEVLLSGGVQFSFTPAMAVDGERLVVAWVGVRKGSDGHSDWSPNDLYYVTSNDSGRTWNPPARITDNASKGIVTAIPQVLIAADQIHIFYTQAKDGGGGQGLRLLNKPPWPIMHQQRAFPVK